MWTYGCACVCVCSGLRAAVADEPGRAAAGARHVSSQLHVNVPVDVFTCIKYQTLHIIATHVIYVNYVRYKHNMSTCVCSSTPITVHLCMTVTPFFARHVVHTSCSMLNIVFMFAYHVVHTSCSMLNIVFMFVCHIVHTSCLMLKI